MSTDNPTFHIESCALHRLARVCRRRTDERRAGSQSPNRRLLREVGSGESSNRAVRLWLVARVRCTNR